jgi:hypothetical protein
LLSKALSDEGEKEENIPEKSQSSGSSTEFHSCKEYLEMFIGCLHVVTVLDNRIIELQSSKGL